MKRFRLALLFTISCFANMIACEISFTTDDSKKETYKANDVVVIEVQVKLTHHHCEISINDTKFTYKGLKIEGATDWTEKQPGIYIRKIKVRVLDDNLKEATLTASRKCQKEGGYGVFILKKA